MTPRVSRRKRRARVNRAGRSSSARARSARGSPGQSGEPRWRLGAASGAIGRLYPNVDGRRLSLCSSGGVVAGPLGAERRPKPLQEERWIDSPQRNSGSRRPEPRRRSRTGRLRPRSKNGRRLTRAADQRVPRPAPPDRVPRSSPRAKVEQPAAATRTNSGTTGRRRSNAAFFSDRASIEWPSSGSSAVRSSSYSLSRAACRPKAVMSSSRLLHRAGAQARQVDATPVGAADMRGGSRAVPPATAGRP